MIKALTFTQSSPSLSWTINHSFDSFPVHDVTTTVNGNVMKILPKSIKRVSASQIVIEFDQPVSGSVRLVGNILGGSTGVAGVGSIDWGATT